MQDLETRLPWHQLDFSPPDGADQHASFLRAGKAQTSAESEETRAAHSRTCLFRDFSPKGLLPGLITLGTASRPAPSLAVIADQYDAVAAHDAQPIRSVWRSHGNRIRRVPRSQPVTAVRPNRELFPITGHTSAMG